MATEEAVGVKPSTGISRPDNMNGPITRPVKRPKSKNTSKRNFAFYLMLLPGVLVLLVNNYLPMIGIIMPFKNYTFHDNFITSLFNSPFVGLDN